MTSAKRRAFLVFGVAMLMLAGTGLCVWLCPTMASRSAWLRMGLPLACALVAAVISWPFVKSLTSDTGAVRFARSALEALITGSRERPMPPTKNRRASELAELLQKLGEIMCAAEDQLAEEGARSGELEASLENARQAAAAKQDEVDRLRQHTEDQLAEEKRKTEELHAELEKVQQALTTAQDGARQLQEQIEGGEQRIESLIMGISDAAMGDLTKRIQVDGEDGFATLGMSVNEMISSLATLVGQLRTTAQQVTEAMNNIQSAATQQASGANEQAASITQTTTSMEELATSAGQIAEHAAGVLGCAEKALANSRICEEAAQEAIQGMANIRNASQSASTTIGGLSDKSRKIGDIIGIIGDIADQTRLLSLNAAIEAARAGEAGKGFSVVATEIRNLADSVTQSTNDIQQILQEIQNSAMACVAATEQGGKRVAEGTEQVTRITDAISQIHDTVEETIQAARQIDVSTRQQQSASEQVAAAMREVAAVASESAQASQQTGEAATELLELAGRLQTTVAAIKVEDA